MEDLGLSWEQTQYIFGFLVAVIVGIYRKVFKNVTIEKIAEAKRTIVYIVAGGMVVTFSFVIGPKMSWQEMLSGFWQLVGIATITHGGAKTIKKRKKAKKWPFKKLTGKHGS